MYLSPGRHLDSTQQHPHVHLPCRGAAATEELGFYWTRSLKSVGGGWWVVGVGGGCGWCGWWVVGGGWWVWVVWVVGGRLCFLSRTLSAFILSCHRLSCYFWCVFILLLFLLLPLLMWSLCFLSPFLVLSSLSPTLHPSPTPLALNTALVRRKMEV